MANLNLKFSELILCNKNFIFAKNGSGKTTLCDAIQSQMNQEYEVHIFKGFESLIGENENLNAFSLAVGAGDKETEIKNIEKEIKLKNEELITIKKQLDANTQGIKNVFSKNEEAIRTYENHSRKIEKFYTNSAAKISSKNNPQIVENARTYNKNFFKNEISKAVFLSDNEVEQLNKILKENFQIISQFTDIKFDAKKSLDAVNEILSSKVEEVIKIKRLDTQEKINFADSGRKIHNKGDKCAFCGGEISDNIFDELESYFSVDEVKKLQLRIKTGKEFLENKQSLIEEIKIDKEKFYPDVLKEVLEEFKIIDELVKEYEYFYDTLYKALDNKEKNLFMEIESIDISVPQELDLTKLNNLINENNKFVNDLKEGKKLARERLRLHEIKGILVSENYDAELVKLKHLEVMKLEQQKEFDFIMKRKNSIEEELLKFEAEIARLKPKAEKIAIEHINYKLRLKVEWELDFFDNSDVGYYRIKQEGKYRSVKKLSTGEKNVIAFLYFIEKLNEIKNNSSKKSKIIVFDDPMSSNDDIMQYLIITELQHLYQGNDKEKFSSEKDFLVIMTHNIHFYLNVQPHGSFKDKNGLTKYDKNNFYRISNHNFIKINSEKEDFKTSYEGLWTELKDLYNCGHRMSMLNTMRRIIETYMNFNNLKQDNFYKGNNQYYKLFNVNSHAIADLSAESFTESIDDMKDLFYQIFDENGCSSHFKKHWK